MGTEYLENTTLVKVKDTQEYYFRQVYRYGREGCISDTSSPKIDISHFSKDEAAVELARFYLKELTYKSVEYRRNMKKWKDEIEFLERYDGDVEKYKRINPKPEISPSKTLVEQIKSLM